THGGGTALRGGRRVRRRLAGACRFGGCRLAGAFRSGGVRLQRRGPCRRRLADQAERVEQAVDLAVLAEGGADAAIGVEDPLRQGRSHARADGRALAFLLLATELPQPVEAGEVVRTDALRQRKRIRNAAPEGGGG